MAGGATGQLLGRMNAEATVTLNADGSGFVKLPMIPEQPATWMEKDGKVTLTVGGNATSGSGKTNPPAPGSGSSVVGTLAADGRTMQVDLGPVQLDLEKSEATAGK